MARIKPLQAIFANHFFAEKLVFTKPQAISVEELVRTGNLIRDMQNAMYVYEISIGDITQTGLWTLTELSDYISGAIKKHEQTFANRVKFLRDYRQCTGLEGSPVMLTYKAEDGIDIILENAKQGECVLNFRTENSVHRLWKISEPTIIQTIIAAFDGIKDVYLADGHHRMQSAASLIIEQQQRGEPVFSTISTLYFSNKQLQIKPYHRILVPKDTYNPTTFLEDLSADYEVKKTEHNILLHPNLDLNLSMRCANNWYHLTAKPHIYLGKAPAEQLGASLLQKYVFEKIFGIVHPNNAQLFYSGGDGASEEITNYLEQYPSAIVFMLKTLTNKEFTDLCDTDAILPPKSTWFDPKIPYGLMLYQH